MDQREEESQSPNIQFAAALEIEQTLEEIGGRLQDLASQVRAWRELRAEPVEVHSDVTIPPDDALERLRRQSA